MEALVAELVSRLPELEWQLSKLDPSVAKLLPPGLFYHPLGSPMSAYIREIKQDIARLDSLISYPRLQYLLLKINQKVHVLVSLCKQKKQATSMAKSTQVLFSTRRALLESLENELVSLTAQQEALSRALTMEHKTAEQRLAVQQELASIEKQLRTTKERYSASW